MLNSVIGADRVDRDQPAWARLTEPVRPPALASRSPAPGWPPDRHWTVRRLVARLEDRSRRLDELDGDGHWAAASMEASYRALEPSAASVPPARADHQPRLAAWVAPPCWTSVRRGRRADRAAGGGAAAGGLPRHGTRYRFQDLVRLHARGARPRRGKPAPAGFRCERALSGWLTLAARRLALRRPHSAHAALPPLLAAGKTHVDTLLFDPHSCWTRNRPPYARPWSTPSRLRHGGLRSRLTSLAIIPTTRTTGPLLRRRATGNSWTVRLSAVRRLDEVRDRFDSYGCC